MGDGLHFILNAAPFDQHSDVSPLHTRKLSHREVCFPAPALTAMYDGAWCSPQCRPTAQLCQPALLPVGDRLREVDLCGLSGLSLCSFMTFPNLSCDKYIGI